MMQAALIRWGAILVAFLMIAGYGLWQRGSKESAYRALDAKKQEVSDLRVTIATEARRREKEQAIGAGQGKATDDADQRERAIRDEYDERMAAALAGRDRDVERLRQQWASSATSCLSASAAAAGEAGRQDELRRASIARVLRDVAAVQSERDEAVDLYQAVWRAQK